MRLKQQDRRNSFPRIGPRFRLRAYQASPHIAKTPAARNMPVMRDEVEALFAFHAGPRNLTEVMPPTLKLVKLVTDGPALEGRLIELHCRDWGFIPMRWLCRWKVVAPPNLLVDEIIEGPFRLFIHEHRFDAAEYGLTRMTDRVTYAWGRNGWGRIVSEIGVRGYLALLFAYRHYRTRRWAEARD